MKPSLYPFNFLIYLSLVVAIFLHSDIKAQCGPGTPNFIVDLSNNPDTTYTSPDTVRIDTCCGATSPDKCVKFTLTLHPNAVGIIFDICDGAVPPGALFYQLGCGPTRQVGEALCLSGTGPHIITFCKPGNNINKYCITSLPQAEVGPPITLNDGCSGQLWINGVADSTIEWRSIAPGAIGAYNSYLNCTAGCDTVSVTAQAGFPSFVDFEVRGATIGLCGATPHIDTIRVYFNSTLAVNIQPQFPTICFGDTAVEITAVGSGGTPPYTFNWSNGATDSNIFVNVGTYIVTMGDSSQCPPTYDTVTVTAFANTISANAGPDQSVCLDDLPVNLNASIVAASGGRWYNGSGAYSPSDTNLNLTYSPDSAEIQSGSVDLHLVTTGNGTCPADTDTVRITLRDFDANVSPIAIDVSCFGDNDGLGIVNLSNALDTPYTFRWDSAAFSQLNDTAIGLGPGTYQVTIIDSGACSLDTNVTINEPGPILVSDTSKDLDCFNDSSGFIFLSVSGGIGPYSFSWSANAPVNSSDSLFQINAGTYSYLLTDSNQCEYRDTFLIQQPLPITVDAGPDRVICVEDSSLQFNGSVQSAGGIQWSGGGSFSSSDTIFNPIYIPSQTERNSGQAIVVATSRANGLCPAVTDTAFVQIRRFTGSPGLTISNVLCNGEANGWAKLNIVGTSGPYQFTWDTIIASFQGDSAFNLAPGSYDIFLSDSGSCAFDTSFTISEPPALLIAPVLNDLLCFNDNSGSIYLNPRGGTAPYSFQWNGPGTPGNADSAVGLQNGSYSVILTDSNGCRLLDTFSIDQPDPLQLTLAKNTGDTICLNANLDLSTIVSGGTPAYSYQWMNSISSGATASLSPTTSSWYAVTVTDQRNCPPVSDSLFVHVINIFEDSLRVFGQSPICQYESTQIAITHIGNYPPYAYTWNQGLSSGSGTKTVSPLNTTLYRVSVTNQCNDVITDSVRIIVYPLPELNLTDTIIESCIPFSVELLNSANNNAGTQFFWQANATVISNDVVLRTRIEDPGTTNISLRLVSPQGCEIEDDSSVAIIARPLPTASFDLPVRKKSLPEVSFDVVNTSISAFENNWFWRDTLQSTEISPLITFDDTGTYPIALIVKNVFGCTDTAIDFLIVGPDLTIEIPNAFYPAKFGANGGRYDTNNPTDQVFFPFVEYVDEFNLKIFDRWGEKVFESNDVNIGWDGYYKGELSQQDVYVWRLAVKFTDGTEKSMKGEVTLLH